ncbi:hypothetical protein ACA910_022602 [Epithemia clementina (nom. ined.)]
MGRRRTVVDNDDADVEEDDTSNRQLDLDRSSTTTAKQRGNQTDKARFPTTAVIVVVVVSLLVATGLACGIAAAAGAFDNNDNGNNNANNAQQRGSSNNSTKDDDKDDDQNDGENATTITTTQAPSSSSSSRQSRTPSQAPSHRRFPHVRTWLCTVVLPEQQCATLDDMQSPQAQAAEWLAADPNWDDTFISSESSDRVSRYALATLYYSTHGDDGDWKNSTHWLDYNTPLCEWYSTASSSSARSSICDDQGNLLVLDLSHNGLHGSLVPELSLLTTLETIQIASSGRHVLTGTLPPTWGSLTSLTTVVITGNNLTGTLPPSNTNWAPSLQTLDLSDNQGLSGVLSTDLGPFPQLTFLDLSRNKFTGAFPSTFLASNEDNGGQVVSSQLVTTLNLNHNEFTSLPDALGEYWQDSLQTLNLRQNRFTTFPTAIVSLTRLQSLDLSFNNMTGRGILSRLVASHTNLETLILGHNALTGPILGGSGSSFSSWTNLSNTLDLSFNQFTGPIPTSIGTLVQLKALYLNDNEGLNGTIPSELGQLSRLSILHLENTGLVGSIPTPVCATLNATSPLTISFADCQDHDDGAPCFLWCCHHNNNNNNNNKADTTVNGCECRHPAGDSVCFRLGTE